MKRYAISMATMFVLFAYAAPDAFARGGRSDDRHDDDHHHHDDHRRQKNVVDRAPTISGTTTGRPPFRVDNSRRSNWPTSRTRPNTSSTRPNTSITRPNTGITRPTTLPSNRPTHGDWNNFLNLPQHTHNRPSTNYRPQVHTQPDVHRDIHHDIHDHWRHRTDRPFDRDWWDRHEGHRHTYKQGHVHWSNSWKNTPRYWSWRPTTWTTVGTWLPYRWNNAYYYDYGNTILYRNNTVYYSGKPIATAGQYYDQAVRIVNSVPRNLDVNRVQWMPLGVFAIAQEGAADTGMILQLALSKEGIIAGTYYNQTTGSSRPVEGMIDARTQRAAWTFVDNLPNQVTFDTGLYNLTKEQTRCLVHFSPGNTQTWTMVRIAAPQ